METSDGISAEDWDIVHEFSVNIVNASVGKNSEVEASELRSSLLHYLDKLEEKYGELPSIVATRADYIDDPTHREQLLIRAYDLAQARDDARNQLDVAHSLAELYIEDLRDATKGHRWLERLKQHLAQAKGSSFAEEYESLRKELQQLNPGLQ